MVLRHFLKTAFFACAAVLAGPAMASDEPFSYVANTAPPDAFLALRTLPGGAGVRIMAMSNGTKLEVIQRRSDAWWYVRVWPTGEIGWAYSGTGKKVYILCCASD